MDIDVGHIVAGKYELVRLLGRGSMGEVWVAHHRTLGEEVAVKLLTRAPGDEELEDDRSAAARFQFEAQVAARLSRKTRHIVSVTDHGEEDGVVYLVMELLQGKTLESVLESFGCVPPATATTIVSQVARALSAAHAEGVLHRDLKPANVFLSRDEDGAILVKLLDFGIARAIHRHKAPSQFSTAKGLVFGTPSYMSPEQARASDKLDHRCDLWALATIAYECLTGELPVAGDDSDEVLKNLCAGRVIPLRARAPDLPEAVDALFEKAFADKVDDRFDTAQAFARALERAVPASTPARPRESVRPRAAAAAAADANAPPATGGDADAPAEDEELRLGMLALRRRARARVAVIAACGAVAALTGVGIAWRIWSKPAEAAGATPVAASGAHAADSPIPLPPPVDSSGTPTIAVSSLPKAVAAAPGRPAPGWAPSGGANAGTSSPQGGAGGYTVVPPPGPAPAPSPAPSPPDNPPSTAPPATAPPAATTTTPKKKPDRSEVL